MATFIITAEPREGEPCKRALYYLRSIGRTRAYRQAFKKPEKGMTLFKYKKKTAAQRWADFINSKGGTNENFKVEQLSK